MDSTPCQPTYSGPQRLMLDRVVGADERIEALLGAGSLANGGFDAHSDLDFVVVVELRQSDPPPQMPEALLDCLRP